MGVNGGGCNNMGGVHTISNKNTNLPGAIIIAYYTNIVLIISLFMPKYLSEDYGF